MYEENYSVNLDAQGTLGVPIEQMVDAADLLMDSDLMHGKPFTKEQIRDVLKLKDANVNLMKIQICCQMLFDWQE